MTHAASQAGLDRLRATLAARVDKGELPGLVTLIAHSDQVHVDAIGFKAFGGTDPMRRETIFRIASMTKPILAAATLKLVEDGTLALSDPVDRWLPELAQPRVLRNIDGPLSDTVPAYRSITVDDLLTFRMGCGLLTEPTFDPPFPIVNAARDLELVLGQPDPRTPHRPDEWIKHFASLPLMYQPGERWLYNVSSLVLGVLVARAAGQPLDDVVRTRICEPLGMRHTGFWLPAELTRDLPPYYMADPQTGEMQRGELSTPEEWSRPAVFPSGAGGLLSTADDYLAFARMLLNKGSHDGQRVLSERSVELMTTNQLTSDQLASAGALLTPNGWGCGTGVVLAPDADWPVPGRYGWQGGYGTVWFNDPHRGIIAIALTQTGDFLWNGSADEFGRLVAGVECCVSP